VPLNVTVVIGATGAGSPWLPDLLASLDGCRWPVAVHYTRDWELATFAWAAERYDEFVFLPQSTVVLDQRVFDRCFEDYEGYGVNLATAQRRPFAMYLGKYRSEVVRAQGVPVVADKADAVLHESQWCMEYARREEANGKLVTVGGPMEHTEVFEERHGRLNMVVQNEYLQRLKSCWDAASLNRVIRELEATG